jgi:hypothetical protein
MYCTPGLMQPFSSPLNTIFSEEQPGLIVGWGVSKVMIDQNGRFIRNHEDNLQMLRVKGIIMYLKNLLHVLTFSIFCFKYFFFC